MRDKTEQAISIRQRGIFMIALASGWIKTRLDAVLVSKAGVANHSMSRAVAAGDYYVRQLPREQTCRGPV